MASNGWKVLPHSPIEKLEDNLWRIQGDLPNMPLKRVMTIARLQNGALAVHNPMALGEEAMREIEAFGSLDFIIVPNGWHRLDAKSFAARYPKARVLAPSGGHAKVRQVVEVAGGVEVLPSDPTVSLVDLDGTKANELVMTVRSSGGTTLVLTDAVFNMPHVSGGQGFLLKYLTQSSGGPRISRVAKLLLIKDKRSFAAHLERLATPDVTRVIVAHHECITHNAAQTLRQVAASI